MTETPNIARGRRLFLGIVGGLLAFGIFGTVGASLRGIPIRATTVVWGPGLMVVLGALAYIGVYWARGAITVWMWLLGFFRVTAALALVRRSPVASLVIFAWAAAFAYGGWYLYNQPDIEAFILRRDRRPMPARRATLLESDE